MAKNIRFALIMGFYKSLIFPVLSQFDPEKIHYFSMKILKGVHSLPLGKEFLTFLFDSKANNKPINLFGLEFKNPVGLAAGFDKNAAWIDPLSTMGFGFIEIGTITPKAQAGNPKPRLFRIKQDKALVNRMGFNNGGTVEALKNLKARKSSILVGGNIGKNKITDNHEAVFDYLIAFNELYDYVDYFVVNVSSPNTPGLRDLQEKEPLTHLLKALKKEIKNRKPKPILLKIAPDLSNSQLDDIIEIVQEANIEGLIASNTTIERKPLTISGSEIEKLGAGGLSGKPLKERSTEVISYLHKKSNGNIPIIGVGGINSADDALEKLEAGASLVQIYSGFIYEGPNLINQICKKIS